MTKGVIGIDLGTQGLTAVFADQHGQVVAHGEGFYQMVPDLPEGCYEQRPSDWEKALVAAVEELKHKLGHLGIEPTFQAIGIAGQMHGEVLTDQQGTPLSPARLWCDSRNEAEGDELTERMQVKMPKRITAARWLYTIRNQPAIAKQTQHLTTPAGWLAWRLTGQWNLGIGDASGMFPIDLSPGDYDSEKLALFDKLTQTYQVPSLRQLLPKVCCAGQDGGSLTEQGARLLGLPAGIPVAPAEGDQPASLAGSLVASAGVVSVSFGTSVCANSVGDRAFQGISPAIDHFCAVDGKPINMVFLRNGTTFMNSLVKLLSGGDESATGFSKIMPLVIEAPDDCQGVLAVPFLDDEPGLGISRGSRGGIWGLNQENATAGNIVKAGLVATMFNLKLGSEILDQQGYPRTNIVLSGGIAKTPELGQILANVMNSPVTLLPDAAEGCAWGAALLAMYRIQSIEVPGKYSWESFLETLPTQKELKFQPEPKSVAAFRQVLERYRDLLQEKKS